MADNGLSRRELLKKGAYLGGALAWATPVVQVVGISPALAADTSPVTTTTTSIPCQTRVAYRAKAEFNGSGYVWESDPGVGHNDCTDCNGAPGIDGSGLLDVSGDDRKVTVSVLSALCAIDGMIVAKAGRGDCIPGVGDSTSMTAEATSPGISHVEVCFSCCAD